jgi:hypothetical protein
MPIVISVYALHIALGSGRFGLRSYLTESGVFNVFYRQKDSRVKLNLTCPQNVGINHGNYGTHHASHSQSTSKLHMTQSGL